MNSILNNRIQKCCIREKTTVLEAMRIITDAAVGLALVVDEQARLLGVLTDGDIRRALLSGATLESPVATFVNRSCTSVRPKDDRAHVLDLMQSRYISQVPVLDDGGRLVGLHLLREMLGAVARPNWAVIMAGGKGTRLRPITENLPKPMIKVAGRPILERLILHLVGFGIKRIFISINYLGHMIENHFGDGSKFGCRIEYLREQHEMGTGGALSLLPEKPLEPFLVMNGDLVTQLNVQKLLEFHESGGFNATLAVRRYFHQVPFGCVDVTENQIRRIEEKPMLQQLVNAGTYVLSPAILEHIPNTFFPITNLFEQCLQRNERLGAWELEEDWLDVGQKEQLKQAQEGQP